MVNYKESDVAGSVYQRCRFVQIDNTLGKTPKLYFLEEEVISIPDRDPMVRDVTSQDLTFDPSAVINLINPVTGESLNRSVTQEELYIILHSLYIQASLARDAAKLSEAEEKAAQDAKIAELAAAMTPKQE